MISKACLAAVLAAGRVLLPAVQQMLPRQRGSWQLDLANKRLPPKLLPDQKTQDLEGQFGLWLADRRTKPAHSHAHFGLRAFQRRIGEVVV